MPEPITQAPATDKSSCCSALNLTAAFILLRLFMGFRLVISGLEKFGVLKKPVPAFGEAIKGKYWFGEGGPAANDGLGDGGAYRIAKVMLDNTNLPVAAVKPFVFVLPYAMVTVGMLILTGLVNRVAWWLAGLIWFSLAFGQMLLPDEGTIQWLGLYVFMCALALVLVDHNRVRLTRF